MTSVLRCDPDNNNVSIVDPMGKTTFSFTIVRRYYPEFNNDPASTTLMGDVVLTTSMSNIETAVNLEMPELIKRFHEATPGVERIWFLLGSVIWTTVNMVNHEIQEDLAASSALNCYLEELPPEELDRLVMESPDLEIIGELLDRIITGEIQEVRRGLLH